MIQRSLFMNACFYCIIFLLWSPFCCLALIPVPLWPTPNTAFAEKKPIESFIQATASGIPSSGCFGCIRSGGASFHEGIDLFPLKKDRKGNALDPVMAVWPGKVAYISNKAGNSAYGVYVVLEHECVTPSAYTLYAHLTHVAPGLKIGQSVGAGEILGIMGNSSTLKIPKSRAHLHFEIGLRLSDQFQSWYQQQSFSTGNKHGIWNGMNLIGMDPLHFFENIQSGSAKELSSYIQALPTAFTLKICSSKVPDFIKRCPSLLSEAIPTEPLQGWEIDFTWYGLPKKWRPLKVCTMNKKEKVAIVFYNKELLKTNYCRKTLIFDKKGNPNLGKELKKILNILFLSSLQLTN